MKNKSLMLLLVAAGCGLVAMIGVQQMLSGEKPTSKTRILVARTEIESGVPLDRTKVGFKEWPNDSIPEGAICTEEEFADRALKHRVGPGQPILASELGNKGEFGLELQIPVDMRVVTYPVTATMTHSGMLRPGNFVDVSAVLEMPIKGGGKRTEVKQVLQCIQVFAVGSRVAGSEESKDPKAAEVKNISFLVFPLQAQLMQLAYKQSNGSLQFALRSGSDKNLVNAADLNEQSLTMMSNSLLGHQDEPKAAPTEHAAAPVAKPKSAFRSYLAPETSESVTSVGEQAVRRTWKIEIFQGDQREITEIDWPEESAQDSNLHFFDRRQKSQKTKSLDPKSTSLDREKGSPASVSQDATETELDDASQTQ
jgi:pilus assembly protein CpaB